MDEVGQQALVILSSSTNDSCIHPINGSGGLAAGTLSNAIERSIQGEQI